MTELTEQRMNRLTFYFRGEAHGKAGATLEKALKAKGGYRGKFEATAIVERLAKYEDAGKEPSEIAELSAQHAADQAEIKRLRDYVHERECYECFNVIGNDKEAEETYCPECKFGKRHASVKETAARYCAPPEATP